VTDDRELLASELLKPWVDHNGPLPEYDHPAACVFDSGVQHTVELLAKELGVDDWTACDGTEEYDGDLGGTLMNIVLAAMPNDEHGDPIYPCDLRDAIARAREEGRVEALTLALPALEEIQLQATNHGGWVENDAWAGVCRIHDMATAAIRSMKGQSNG
jgi:hypothetical protein